MRVTVQNLRSPPRRGTGRPPTRANLYSLGAVAAAINAARPVGADGCVADQVALQHLISSHAIDNTVHICTYNDVPRATRQVILRSTGGPRTIALKAWGRVSEQRRASRQFFSLEWEQRIKGSNAGRSSLEKRPLMVGRPAATRALRLLSLVSSRLT